MSVSLAKRPQVMSLGSPALSRGRAVKFTNELSALPKKKRRHCAVLGKPCSGISRLACQSRLPAQLPRGESWESPGCRLSRQSQSRPASPERDPDLFAHPKPLDSPSSRGTAFRHLFAFRGADLGSGVKGKSESSRLCAWCPLL